MEITIVSFMNGGPSFSPETETAWLSGKMDNGKKIVFWGSAYEGTRNIDSLKNQKLPVSVFIESPEDCVPSVLVSKKYGATISVPEHVKIQVNPCI